MLLNRVEITYTGHSAYYQYFVIHSQPGNHPYERLNLRWPRDIWSLEHIAPIPMGWPTCNSAEQNVTSKFAGIAGLSRSWRIFIVNSPRGWILRQRRHPPQPLRHPLPYLHRHWLHFSVYHYHGPCHPLQWAQPEYHYNDWWLMTTFYLLSAIR